MDMDYLDNLKCPQYVCFESDILGNNDSLEGLENLSSCSSVKEEISVNMDVEEVENSNISCPKDDQSPPRSIGSSFTESYLADSTYQETPGPIPVQSGLIAEDFPVIRPNNLSLPDKNLKKDSKKYKNTKIHPFHLTESKKRKREDELVPLAEQIAAFHKKTPQRFHTVGIKDFQPPKHWSPPIIIPKSPNLQAAKRCRGVNIISREEQEKKEAEEMKRYKFRARPVNHHILQHPQGPKVRKKTPIKSRSFNLRTAQRAAENYEKHKEEEEKPFEFHARPVPKAILNGPTGLKEKTILPVTEAKTPNFALKNREQKWKTEYKMNTTVAEMQAFKALPAPVVTEPFVVKHEKKRTAIQPFSFDTRDKERMKQKEQKIKEEMEKENSVYVFKAQPMPSPAQSALPEVLKKPITHPQPFSFHLDQKSSRHDSFNSTFNSPLTTFKAHPATVLKKPPFIPEKASKPGVEIQEFHLLTDVRASERQKLKELNAIKEQEKELVLQQMKALQEEEEHKMILKLRKEAVHKANPIRYYKPVDIKPSSKPPTEPISPKFKTDERLQLKHK